MRKKAVFYLNLMMTLFGLVIASSLNSKLWGATADFSIYGVYRGVDLGNPGEPPPQKDYYVNMGSTHGLKEGMLLEVVRRAPSYDLENQQYYRDVSFPIARLKVIHVNSLTAITRLEKMLPIESTPVISPRTIMVGDLVRPVSK